MTKKPLKNIAASVQARLLALSRERGEDFQLLLTRYALERLLYRLAESPHSGGFVLKGAMLFALWTGQPHRATRDLDLLGFGDVTIPSLETLFRELCALKVADDGLVFDAARVQGSLIREDQDYGGVCIEMEARLGVARVSLQVDVGIGDAVKPVVVTYPTLLDFPAPKLWAYPRETVVAEKLQAMVTLGIANSRMKDFYDLWMLARTFEFDGERLAKAIDATFKRRKTELTGQPPLALTPTFATDPSKMTQWQAFLRRTRLGEDAGDLAEVVAEVRVFLLPVLEALGAGIQFASKWKPRGPWTAT
ncbi:MAG TPA: nucleotidyl transferase AbiEii/AbiGii toxin family protein [Myxococcales bacterium]